MNTAGRLMAMNTNTNWFLKARLKTRQLLLKRVTSGMEPMVYGEAMIRHARMALASLAHAHDDLVALKSGLTGRVEVGVHLESSHVLLDKLRRGMLDFVIGRIQEGTTAWS
jgi:hypothetical protein